MEVGLVASGGDSGSLATGGTSFLVDGNAVFGGMADAQPDAELINDAVEGF